MKKLMSLGCLLALAFAGASAFATTWFANAVGGSTADVMNDSTKIGDWTVTSVDGGWTWTSGDVSYGTLKDWTDGVKFTADPVKSMDGEDVTFTTEVNFTSAMDSEDLPDLTTDEYQGVKGGLTVVEVPGSDPVSYAYYGIIERSGVKVWEPLTSVTSPHLGTFVTVKVALIKKGDATAIKYSVDDELLSTGNVDVFEMTYTNLAINSVEFKGMCQLKSLGGLAYDNTPAAKEEIAVTPTEGKVPSAISYNRQDLLNRGIDPDNETAVTAYLTTQQANGQYGWVNAKLGLGDAKGNEIAARDTTQFTNEYVAVDFGVDISKNEDEISYTVNGVASDFPGIEIVNSVEEGSVKEENTKISEVKLYVKGDDDKDYEVGSALVGVMETGKETPGKKKGDKTFDIVAVPWASFGDGNVTVANVLNTEVLTVGDTLYILNDGKYDTYTLDTEKKWQAIGETSYSRTQNQEVNKKAPEAYELGVGDAIWIERDVSSRIIFAGKGETNVAPWSWTEGEYSLVANPTINTFVLPSKDAGNANFGKDGDMIIVEDVENPKQFEKVNGEWGEWQKDTKTIRGKNVTTLKFVAGGEIPAGIGFWYYNKGATGAVTIDFGKNTDPLQ